MTKIINLINMYKNRAVEYPATIRAVHKEFINVFGNKNVNKKTITNYVKNLRISGYKPATINWKISQLQALFRLSEIVVPRIKREKIEHDKIITCSRNVIAQMYTYCRKNKAKELLTMLRIALNTGARVNNVLKIKKSDIEKGYIRFYKNKTNKPYSVPINKRIKRLMAQYEPFTSNYQAMYYQFEIMKKRLNLNNEITIHSLRHTFATELLSKGASIADIQQLLNHTDIKTTMIYAHLKNERLERAVNLL